MYLLLLEAFGAMVLLILIVWWTMFSGREKGELKVDPPEEEKILAEPKPELEPKPEPKPELKVNPEPTDRA
jgi:hypothetical protein